MSKGYIHHKKADKWYVRTIVDGKIKNIGCKTEEDAIKLVKELRETKPTSQQIQDIDTILEAVADMIKGLEDRVAFLEEQLEMRAPQTVTTQDESDPMAQVYSRFNNMSIAKEANLSNRIN